MVRSVDRLERRIVGLESVPEIDALKVGHSLLQDEVK